MAQSPKIGIGGPAWRPGEATLSVGQIAERLRPIAPDVAATVQRIRHWTREGLMFPAGDLHTGTGNARLYPASLVCDAAILMLTTTAGLNIASMRFLRDALTQFRFALPTWKGGPFYLKIFKDGDGRTESDILWTEPSKPTADLTIIIDLAKLLSRVGWPP